MSIFKDDFFTGWVPSMAMSENAPHQQQQQQLEGSVTNTNYSMGTRNSIKLIYILIQH